MSRDRILAALRDASDTDDVVLGTGALASMDELYMRGFGAAPAIVVGDETTMAVAGRAVGERLAAAGVAPREPYVFPGRPTLHADYEHVRTLVAALREHDAVPVAVGSGTINDVVKRAAGECERRYLSVATAASMDGYTAFGAAITEEGYKHTMACPAPRAVLADVDVLAAAPAAMTSAGYADLLAKIPAGADWIVADALEVEAIDAAVWALVQEPLREATARPGALHTDRRAMEELIEGLVMSGLAMQAHASSRPASGAEHQFSHLWEMEGLGQDPGDDGPPLSHGFKVGVGTVAIAALYERVLARDLERLDIDAAVAAWPAWAEAEAAVRAAHPTPGLDEAAVEEARAKHVEPAALGERLDKLRASWPQLCTRLRKQLLSAEEIETRLRAAGAPTSPGEIGLSAGELARTYDRARTIRRRYTVLDLAHEAGILAGCVDELFAADGYWGRRLGPRQAPAP